MTKLHDVAQLAQVSLSTVSRALSRPDLVSVSTRTRVLQAAQQLGYQPNHLARNFRRQKSGLLGLVVTDILTPFHATVAKGVQDAAEKLGYGVFVFNTDEQPEKEARYLHQLRAHQLEGLMIVPTARTHENLSMVGQLPVIEIDRTSGSAGVHSVMVENAPGARQAVEHLIAQGHRRIGMIAGTQIVTTATERLEGYRQALIHADIRPDDRLVAIGYHREEGGRQATHTLLSLPRKIRPTALFAGNSEMAAGTVLAIRELGLKIPTDISLVTFDDTRWAQLMDPPLTVVAQPAYELGYLACETLISLLSREKRGVSTTLRLAPQLVVRQSVAAPRS